VVEAGVEAIAGEELGVGAPLDRASGLVRRCDSSSAPDVLEDFVNEIGETRLMVFLCRLGRPNVLVMREGSHPGIVWRRVVPKHASPVAILEMETIAGPDWVAVRDVDRDTHVQLVAVWVRQC
jgi:hypothetical protein